MGDATDLVVVSHACVLASNQQVYASLARRGTAVELVVPARWRSDFAPAGFAAQVHPGLAGHVHTVGVLGQGHQQRHVHLARGAATLRRLSPAAVFIEEEPFSVAAWRWSRAARRLGVPYGVQLAETLDRSFPGPVDRAMRRVLGAASFVVARSPSAAALAARWGATCEVAVVPHGVDVVDERAEPDGIFTVAFVGRLVEDKGITDLLAAAAELDDRVSVVVVGDGPLAGAVARAGHGVTSLGAVPHERIGEVYARAHLTCVPSRTAPTWEEQFGRVLVESLVRGVPVVATSTGEIPWVLGATGGGVLVPERDPSALATAIRALATDRDGARDLGRAGRAGVLAHFTNDAAAGVLADLVGRVSPARRSL